MSFAERMDHLEGLEEETRNSVGVLTTVLGKISRRWDNRFDEIEARFDYQNKRLGDLKTCVTAFIDETRERFDQQDKKIEAQFAEQDRKFEERFAEQDRKFEERFDYQNKRLGDLKTCVTEFIAETRERFDRQDERIDALQSDVEVLKSDVAELKSDVAGLKSDMKEVKSDVIVLKSDMATLKDEVKLLTYNFGEMRSALKRQEEMLTTLLSRSE